MHAHVWVNLCSPWMRSPRSHTQTEVCFVLTGWWSGTPVRGLHPEGESQVLPGCRGAGQSAVLPGAHIWGKGKHSNSTVARLDPLSSEKHCGENTATSSKLSSLIKSHLRLVTLHLRSQLYVQAQKLMYSANVTWSSFSGKWVGWKEPRAPWKPDIHLVHPCWGRAKIQWSQAGLHRKAAEPKAATASTVVSLMSFSSQGSQTTPHLWGPVVRW